MKLVRDIDDTGRDGGRRRVIMKRSEGLWKVVIMAAALAGLDGAMTTQIMGLSYGPFSWLSIASANASVYPVITDIRAAASTVKVRANVENGVEYILQKRTNLIQSGSWQDLTPAVTAESSEATFQDTGVLDDERFYRVKRVTP